MYQPPLEITSKTIELISRISERLGEISSLLHSPYQIKLRKENQIKTIHASLAIENNSLSLEQITAIIEGKRVLVFSPTVIGSVTENKRNLDRE